MSTSATHFSGVDLLDETGHRLGTVEDVVYDDPEVLEPTWLVVKPGMLRGHHYVPVAGSYRTTDAKLVSPYSADQIKSAPKAGSEHVLDADTRTRLIEHYELS